MSNTLDVKPEPMHFTRIAPTENGGSAFEEGRVDLQHLHIVDGVPPMAIGAMPSAAGVQFVRGDAFDSTAHPAPREQWVIMLQGTIEVTVSDGTQRRFAPGDLILATDTTGTGHVTTGIGAPPFDALFIPL